MKNDRIHNMTFTVSDAPTCSDTYADVALLISQAGDVVAIPCWHDHVAGSRFPTLRPWTMITIPEGKPTWTVNEDSDTVTITAPLVDQVATVLDINGRPVEVLVRACFGKSYTTFKQRLPAFISDWQIASTILTAGQCVSRLLSGPREDLVAHVLMPSRVEDVMACDDGDTFESQIEECPDDDLETCIPPMVVLIGGLRASYT